MKQLQGNLMTRTSLPRMEWDISATRFRRRLFCDGLFGHRPFGDDRFGDESVDKKL